MKKTVLFLVILMLLFALVFVMILVRKTNDTVEEEVYKLEYSEYVEKYSDKYEVPESLIFAVIRTESNFKADAVSASGAMGLMQMMPLTFKDMQSRIGEEYEDEMLLDPEVNIKYGTYYLAYLYRYFKNWDNAIAAYNAGMGYVSSWLDNEEYSQDGELINIPFSETDRYLKKVKSSLLKYEEILEKEEVESYE